MITPKRAGLAVALVWLAFAVPSLRSFGLTIDSPALFYAGDRTLFAATHPTLPNALDFSHRDPKEFHSAYTRSPGWDDPIHYPIGPSLVASVVSRLFHDGLGWLNDLDAHQLGLVLLHALGLYFFCVYASRLLGLTGGLAAVIFLALDPLAIGHAFNNAKDWPCAMFYALAVMAAGVGLIDERWQELLASAIFLSFSFASKLNALFAVVTIVAMLPVLYFLLYRHRALPRGIVVALLLAPYIVAILSFLSWPWLYQGRPSDWVRHVADYLEFMLAYGNGARQTWTDFALRCLFLTTPPFMLLAMLAYLFRGFSGTRRERAVWAVLVIWLGLILARVAVPHSNFYDGSRHFIEFIPATAALAGGGLAIFLRWSQGWTDISRLVARTRQSALALGAVSLLVPIVQYHPYEASYFNFLTGGLGGAQARQVLAVPSPQDWRATGTEGDYWFSSFREAMREFRRVRGPQQTLAVCGPWREQADEGTWPAEFRTPFADIAVADYVYANYRRTECRDFIDKALASGRPIAKEVRRDGGLIFYLFGPVARP